MMTAKQNNISVLFASPHALTRELMMGALNRHEHFHVVACASTTREVLEAVQSADVDVALIGGTLADGPMSGFGVLRQIRECSPQVKSVLLFYGPERHLVVNAFRAGARGVFCLSQSNFKSLCRCVEQVHAGQVWANSSELSEVVEAFSQIAPIRLVNASGMELLTRREEDVVRLLAEGLQNRDIASELNLSEHTIKNYLFHIFDKLGVSSRVELVLYAVSSAGRSRTSGVQSDKQERKPVGSVGIAGRLSMDADQHPKANVSRSRGERAMGLSMVR